MTGILRELFRQRITLAGLTGVLVILSCPLTALSQKATEQFIPIGQSPGLSGQYTYIGALEAVNTTARTITVEGRSVQVTDATRIWLDRSIAQQPNLSGGFDDLRPGRSVEVRYMDTERRERAAWIKIVPSSGS